MTSRASLSAAKDVNYTAERILHALEVIVFAPSTAPAVAEAIGVHPRTVRRMLRTLSRHQYVERHDERSRNIYRPTVRLLAMAAQLAPRLPLVEHGRHTARELHRASAMTAYLAIPSYGDVLVIARVGDNSPRLWALVPAAEDAAGLLLLAYRDAWRHSVKDTHDRASETIEASLVRERGYASITREGGRTGSIAVPVAAQDTAPLAALAIQGPSSALRARETELIDLLQHAAMQLACRTSARE